ncbi:MAG: D-alanyl-D-alanine carboxypeptidase family protein [Candidatus Saccharibacteria bacterium]|nr:D-alanyl-D-alanine carboxypeptidase family protein [Candidatus Saccharibacteria bacterium]
MKKGTVGNLLVVFAVFFLFSLLGLHMDAQANDASDMPYVRTIESTYDIPRQDAEELLDPERNYLIIVNSTHRYDFSGKYHQALQPDLVYFPNAVDGDIMAVEKAAYLAFTSLQYDLKTNYGIEIELYDGYRSATDQEYINSLYNGGATNIGSSADVGFTEHHTGLLLDVVLHNSKDKQRYIEQYGEDSEWLSANSERLKSGDFKTAYEKMVDYGFIIRYPSNKSDITGVKGMEYEIRFVGSAGIAHAITGNNLCLEEYVYNCL